MGCDCWYASNSARRAFRERRNSTAFEELRSRIVGREIPKRRYEVARRASRLCSKDGNLLRSDFVNRRVWNQYTRPSCLFQSQHRVLTFNISFDLMCMDMSLESRKLTLFVNNPSSLSVSKPSPVYADA